MAIFTSSPSVSVASGRVASIVLQRSPHGYQSRAGVFTSSKSNDARRIRMATFGSLAQLWRSLTPSQAETWRRLAVELPPAADRIRPYRVGGFNLFVGCNMNRAEINLPPLLEAAFPATLARYTVQVVTASIGTSNLTISLTRLGGAPQQIAWYGSAFLRPGRRNFNGLPLRRFRVSNVIAASNVFSQLVAAVGSPSSSQVGSQTVIRHVVIDPGGFASEPYETIVTWAA